MFYITSRLLRYNELALEVFPASLRWPVLKHLVLFSRSFSSGCLVDSALRTSREIC